MDKTTTHPKKLKTYCKVCERSYEVSNPKQIVKGRDPSKYAIRCPICGFRIALPLKEVEDVFGELKV